ncbi:Clp protease ClpP [Streptomyces caniscabiei]|uniref:ATP-dependent Clp protease proteolytic subunit n=1 Tax=Streptomyces caniscabiei TaxID=2746961 RepID=A0A927L0Z4_9ACTN|nr:head maturation protease, ClpP-related [Streptomyces caniscabiei]MBD9723452.1 Clp protease ClpP [Streptomyces caniscabiei]MDX3516050.1 Clp protease ClpP [Streptomyces caniscabiei]MDX3725144.1 Clp protease ClpP [Streptomyces caniscabiei]WEO27022.1 Clp protease ClpP [Streptomyces caniscabiei]
MPFIDLPERIPGLHARAREPRSWYRITNQAADEAEVMLYDEVGGWLGATADEFINDLRGITAPNILLRVNSPGGSVTEGIAIANALRSHPASVTVQVDGVAASIASVIAMAGDHIRMMPNALLMVHEASGLCVGEAADMIKMAELLDKISDNIAGAYAARAGGTEAEWRQVMKNETWYRGEEAVAAGLADEVVQAPQTDQSVSARAGEPDMARAFDLTAYGYQGPHQPEPPKPTPPAAPDVTEHVAGPPQLVISVADLLDEDTVARLRAAVAPPVEEQPAAPAVEPAPETPAVAEALPATDTTGPNPEPADEWAATVAHLTQPDPNPWAGLVSHLTEPTASSSAATEAA